MRQTKVTYGNCLLGVLYLWSRGKVGYVVAIKRERGWYPSHYGVISKDKKRYAHFYKTVKPELDKFPPFWYRGSFQILKLEDAIDQFKIEMCHRRSIAKLLFLTAVLYVPFATGWVIYPHWVFIRDTYLGWKGRR